MSRTEAAGHHTGSAQPRPEIGRFARGKNDLPAVLARVSGARYEPLAGGGAEKGTEVERTGGEIRVEQRGRLLPRIGTLHRDHREVEARLHGDFKAARVRAQPLDILVARAGVHDHPVVVVVEVVDDQVVDDAAVFAQHAGVERLAGHGQPGDVVGQQAAQEVAHARAPQVDDAHVRDVEHACVATHAVVFLDLGAVVDRHVPAAEVDDARRGCDVRFVERSSQTHFLVSRTPRTKKKRQAATTCRPSVL